MQKNFSLGKMPLHLRKLLLTKSNHTCKNIYCTDFCSISEQENNGFKHDASLSSIAKDNNI